MTGRTAETNRGGRKGQTGKEREKGGGWEGEQEEQEELQTINERTNGSHHLGFPAYCLNNIGAKFDANHAKIASAVRDSVYTWKQSMMP